MLWETGTMCEVGWVGLTQTGPAGKFWEGSSIHNELIGMCLLVQKNCMELNVCLKIMERNNIKMNVNIAVITVYVRCSYRQSDVSRLLI